jgi:glycosyltransferase involved in cell wall biosynthesis
VQHGEITAQLFAERPVMLRDLPPLLGPQAFCDGPIILLNNSLAWGGAERQLVTTLRGLDGRAGRRLGLLCMRLGGGPEYDFFGPALRGFEGIVRNAIDLAGARRLVAAAAPPQAVARARDAIQWLPNDVQDEIERLAGDFVQLRPAVVHAWQDPASIAAAYAARIVGVPRVIVSGRNLSPPNFAYYRPYMTDAYREVASIPEIVMLNNSAAGAADYAIWLGLPGNRLQVLRNGVDPAASAPPPAGTRERLRAALGIPETAPVVGSIFRFYEEKRPLLWAEVAALIGAARPDCHFVIIGTGPLHGAVLKRAQKGGFADRMHCPGPSSETAAYLSLFDVFLLTSRAEGTPNVVLEASLAGVPVVATAAGGSAEAVDDGVSGVLVRDDSAAMIAARVIEVLDDPKWRERARTAGPAFVQRLFGEERMLDETLALYRQ